MNKINNIVNEAKRIEEDAIYSSKSHYESADSWSNAYLWLGIPTAIIAGISGVSAFEEYKLVAGISGIIAATLASINTFLNPSEKAQIHFTAGQKFTSLKNRARIFYEIEILNDDKESIEKKLLILASERDSLNEVSPQIPRKAFEAARKGIEEGEAQYVVDKGVVK